MGESVLLSAANSGSAGLKIAGGIMEAKGTAEGLAHKGAQATMAARAGRTAAAETDTALQSELRTTLGHIDAIRASSGVAVNSPTGQVISSNEARVSDRERRIRVGNLMAQARSDEASAAFYRRSARAAFTAGVISTAGQAISLFSPGSGAMGGDRHVGVNDPRRIGSLY